MDSVTNRNCHSTGYGSIPSGSAPTLTKLPRKAGALHIRSRPAKRANRRHGLGTTMLQLIFDVCTFGYYLRETSLGVVYRAVPGRLLNGSKSTDGSHQSQLTRLLRRMSPERTARRMPRAADQLRQQHWLTASLVAFGQNSRLRRSLVLRTKTTQANGTLHAKMRRRSATGLRTLKDLNSSAPL